MQDNDKNGEKNGGKNGALVQKVYSHIWEMIQAQGLSFAMLAIAVWYFQGQNLNLQKKIEQCQKDRIEVYKEQNMALMNVVENNSEAFLQFSYELRKINNNGEKH